MSRVAIFSAAILSVVSGSSLRTDIGQTAIVPKSYADSLNKHGLSAKKVESLQKFGAKMKADGLLKPVVETNKMAVEATANGWVYMNYYENSTVYANGCTSAPVEQTAFLSGYCIDFINAGSGVSYTCSSAGVLTFTMYTDAACTTGAISGVVPTTCDMTNQGQYYNGVMENTKFVCGSSSSGLSWSVSTPYLQQALYTATGCSDSTLVVAQALQQNSCYGFDDDSVTGSGSGKYVSPNGYTYDGLVCAGTATDTETVTLNTCVIDTDTALYRQYTENNSASMIMGNLSMISAFIGLAAVVLSIM